MLITPSENEYPSYYTNYIRLVLEGSLLDRLSNQLHETQSLLENLTEEEANYRYAPGKWTLKEVIGHITDTERIMSYRLLRIARGDQTPLAGFNEEDYVNEALFQHRSVIDLLEDYKAVRLSTLSLMKGLSDGVWIKTGIANSYETTARAIAYIIAGHELHHVNIIRNKYLTNG